MYYFDDGTREEIAMDHYARELEGRWIRALMARHPELCLSCGERDVDMAAWDYTPEYHVCTTCKDGVPF